jgi:DNA-binding MarR family transcriptional regulator
MESFTDVVLDGEPAPSGRPGSSTSRSPAEPAATGDELGSLDGLADQIIRLVRTWSHLKARMVSTIDPEVGALFLISRLIKGGPTRAKDLAEATCADQSTVSRQVAALVKSGLIERQADPDDGRASILVPTPLGVARVNEHFANRGYALEPLVDEWSAAEREQFVDLLRRFTSNLESRRDEVARAMTQSHGQTTERLRGTRAEFRSDTTAVNQPTHLQHHEHVHLHASSERSN